MKQKTIHIIVSLIMVVCIIATGIMGPTIASGYGMYKEAINKKSLSSIIYEAQNGEGYVRLEDISEEYLGQLLKSEDKRFYRHFGIDLIATARAIYYDVKAGAFVQGGSTITQQLAKNIYFTSDKNIERKIAELIVALQLEDRMTKDEILELYCNVIYFGEGCYGIKSAANHYYGVAPSNLTEEQAAALVKTIKRPNDYNPNALRIWQAASE